MDDFGVPTNMFGNVPEDFIRAIGRIVMLSALVENMFGSVVASLERVPEEKVAGAQMGELLQRFEAVSMERTLAARTIDARNETKALMAQRNELVHSLWPFHYGRAPQGWRTVKAKKRDDPSKYVTWVETDDARLRLLIERLVACWSELQALHSTPDLWGGL